MSEDRTVEERSCLKQRDRYYTVLDRAQYLANKRPVSERDVREINELRDIMRSIQNEERFGVD